MALSLAYLTSANKFETIYLKHGTTITKTAGPSVLHPHALAVGHPAGDRGVTKSHRGGPSQKAPAQNSTV